MFQGPNSPLRQTRPPSPLDPAQQNDFRERTITPEANAQTWHDENAATEAPRKVEPTVELLPDEWAPITIPVGTLSTTPRRFLGSDRTRRSAVMQNIGTEDLQLATDRAKFATNAADISHFVYVLPAGAAVTVTSTREFWVRAPVGSTAGLTVLIERGVRDR